MELSPTQQRALDAALHGANLFITGPAGTGKTVLLLEIIAKLREAGRDVAVTASTGLAAVHLGGRTVHSCLGTGVCRNKEELRRFERDEDGAGMLHGVTPHLQRMDCLVIDEISMLSGDFLDMIDDRLRRVRQRDEPFGGTQVIVSGDFMQLPPVTREEESPPVHRFAFQAPAWEELGIVPVLLKEVFRQREKPFLEALEAIRMGRFPERHARLFDERVVNSEEKIFRRNPTRLYPTKKQVSAINSYMLKKRPPFRGRKAYRFQAELFPRKHHGREIDRTAWTEAFGHAFVADPELVLKEGVPVLFLANRDPDGGIVNGTRATVVSVDRDHVRLHLANRRTVTLDAVKDRVRWELQSAEGKTRASIRQLPIKLAFALTVHKSQGMSLDPVHVALTSNFEAGQVYVALSRARRLAGLTLDRPLDPRTDLRVDPECRSFYERMDEGA